MTPTASPAGRRSAAAAAAAAIREVGFVAIIRGDFAVEEIRKIGETLAAESFTVIEVALNTPDAIEAIRELAATLGDAALVGAGTVLTAEDVERVAAVGGRFLVAPSFDQDVVAAASERDMLYLPGVLTPTEVITAARAGCRMVKLFPADAVGPVHLRALRAPLNDVDFVPTGGVEPANVGSYVQAGAVALGVGGALVTGPRQSLDDLVQRARGLRRAWIHAHGG